MHSTSRHRSRPFASCLRTLAQLSLALLLLVASVACYRTGNSSSSTKDASVGGDSSPADTQLDVGADLQADSGSQDASLDLAPSDVLLDVAAEDTPSDVALQDVPSDVAVEDVLSDIAQDSEPPDGQADVVADLSTGDTQGADVVELPSYRKCDELNFCTLAEQGCCNSCGEVPFEKWTPIGGDRYTELHSATCHDPNPQCQECATLPPNENFVALCEQGVCDKYDVRSSFLSVCKEPKDCRPVWADCCGCGPRVVAIAESQIQTWWQAICDPRVDCMPCTQVEPTNAVTCDSGHCALVK